MRRVVRSGNCAALRSVASFVRGEIRAWRDSCVARFVRGEVCDACLSSDVITTLDRHAVRVWLASRYRMRLHGPVADLTGCPPRILGARGNALLTKQIAIGHGCRVKPAPQLGIYHLPDLQGGESWRPADAAGACT